MSSWYKQYKMDLLANMDTGTLQLSFRVFYFISILVLFNLPKLGPAQSLLEVPGIFTLLEASTVRSLFPFVRYLAICLAIFAIVYSQSQIVRFTFGGSCLFLVAAINSYGSIGHNYHFWVWCCLFYGLLSGNTANQRGHQLATQSEIFFLLQVLGALFYFTSGFWKLVHISECFYNPSYECRFDLFLFSDIMAHERVNFPQFAPLWDLVFTNPIVGLLGYLAVLGFQLSSLYFVLKLSFHRAFGMFSLVFHLLNLLIMGISFLPMALALIPVYLVSPFANRGRPQSFFTSTLSYGLGSFFIISLQSWSRVLVKNGSGIGIWFLLAWLLVNLMMLLKPAQNKLVIAWVVFYLLFRAGF